MSVVESYETPQTLAALPLGVNHPGRCLRLVVRERVPTHVREYGEGLVMSLFGSLRVSSDGNEPRVRLNFYNEWASAASFVDPGDIIILKGFRLVAFPVVADGLPPSPPPRNGRGVEEDKFFVVPIPQLTTLRAVQKDPDTGVTAEVTVEAGRLDEPRVRVMPVQPPACSPSDLPVRPTL